MANWWDDSPVVSQAAPAAKPAAFDRGAALAETDKLLKLPAGFSAAQLQVESGGNPKARSPAGAMGLAQVMPATLATLSTRLGRKLNPDDEQDAVTIHREVMRENLAKFKTPDRALMAYNGGWDESKWGNPETSSYVGKVSKALKGQNPVMAAAGKAVNAVMPSAQASTPAGADQWWANAPLATAEPSAAPTPTPAGKPGPSKDYEAGRQAPGALQGLLSVMNGPLMGFGDEVAGVIGAGIDGVRKGANFADAYRENRDFARGAQDNQKEVNPWTTGLTQVAASLPLGALKLGGAAVGAAAKPVNMLGQMLNAGKTGAIYGAAAGAGNSTADTVGGLVKDTAIGGVTGAALSSAAVPVSRVLGAAGSNVAQRVSANSANRAAEEKVAEALVRDGRGSVVQSGASNPVTQATARLNKLGDGAVVADAGGQNTKSLLDLLATLPGKTKDAANTLIHDRQSGRASRLIGSAEKSLGTNGDRLAGTVDDLVAMRATAAEPLYQQVGQTTIAQPSAALRAAVAAADDLGATKIGQQMSTARQVPYTLDTQNPANWAMRDLDHVKQGMDQLIAKQWDAVNGKLTPLGSSYQQLKDRLVGELDSATINPQTGASLYKSARDAFAGPSALIDAARAGQSSISKNEATISQMVGKFSTSEQEAFKVGAFEALREKIGRSEGGRTEIIDMWKNPAVSAKLKALFGDERAFREFAATAAKEGRMKGLESIGRGSQTAARQYAAGDLDVGALKDASQAVGSAASGNIPGMLSSVAGAWNRVKTPEATRNAMGQILMSGGQAGQNRLAAMADMTARINAQHAQTNGLMSVIAAKPSGSWFLD